MQQRTTSTQNFYRRKLPSSCINFASPEGKKLFTESLVKGLNFTNYSSHCKRKF